MGTRVLGHGPVSYSTFASVLTVIYFVALRESKILVQNLKKKKKKKSKQWSHYTLFSPSGNNNRFRVFGAKVTSWNVKVVLKQTNMFARHPVSIIGCALTPPVTGLMPTACSWPDLPPGLRCWLMVSLEMCSGSVAWFSNSYLSKTSNGRWNLPHPKMDLREWKTTFPSQLLTVEQRVHFRFESDKAWNALKEEAEYHRVGLKCLYHFRKTLGWIVLLI